MHENTKYRWCSLSQHSIYAKIVSNEINNGVWQLLVDLWVCLIHWCVCRVCRNYLYNMIQRKMIAYEIKMSKRVQPSKISWLHYVHWNLLFFNGINFNFENYLTAFIHIHVLHTLKFLPKKKRHMCYMYLLYFIHLDDFSLKSNQKRTKKKKHG